MSVLIKGMDLPAKDDFYRLLLVCHSDGTADAIAATAIIKGEPFEIIEVPPHGRLIDADKLRLEIEKYFAGLPIQGRYDMLKMVDEAPTIIEVEEGDRNDE